MSNAPTWRAPYGTDARMETAYSLGWTHEAAIEILNDLHRIGHPTTKRALRELDAYARAMGWSPLEAIRHIAKQKKDLGL